MDRPIRKRHAPLVLLDMRELFYWTSLHPLQTQSTLWPAPCVLVERTSGLRAASTQFVVMHGPVHRLFRRYVVSSIVVISSLGSHCSIFPETFRPFVRNSLKTSRHFFVLRHFWDWKRHYNRFDFIFFGHFKENSLGGRKKQTLLRPVVTWPPHLLHFSMFSGATCVLQKSHPSQRSSIVLHQRRQPVHLPGT